MDFYRVFKIVCINTHLSSKAEKIISERCLPISSVVSVHRFEKGALVFSFKVCCVNVTELQNSIKLIHYEEVTQCQSAI